MTAAEAPHGRARAALVVVVLLLAAAFAAPAQAGAGPTTVLVTVSRTGGPANGGSTLDAITPDGTFVLFDSRASNLVAGDSNGLQDVFVQNLVTGRTARVSVGAHHRQANRACFGNAISSDGRFVVFTSVASDLVRRPDTNGVSDVFLRDRATGRTIRVSVSTSGRQFDQPSSGGVVSRDGSIVAFTHGINPDTWYVEIRNRTAGTTRPISRKQDTVPDAISEDGRYLTFSVEDHHGDAGWIDVRNRLSGRQVQVPSPQGGPVFGVVATPDARYVGFSALDPNGGGQDAFLWRRGAATSTTIRNEPDGFIGVNGISSDGRYVAVTDGSALAAGDTNGIADVYRIDMTGGAAVRASVSDVAGQLPHGAFGGPVSMTGDGTMIAFVTRDPGVAADTNHANDVYVRIGL
jgi:TolB protein